MYFIHKWHLISGTSHKFYVRLLSGIVVVLNLLLVSGSLRAQSEISIIPMPASVHIKKGSLILDHQANVAAKGLSADDRAFLISQLGSAIEWTTTENGRKADLNIELTDTSELTGAYTLNIGSGGIRLRSGSREGVLNGIATLNQVLYQGGRNNSYALPYLAIEDAPAYQYRGFMLDASRHFQSVDKVKHLLDLMSALKLNVFHWHLTDNEGWRIESRKFPKLNQTGSYISKIGRKAKPEDEEVNGFYTIEQIRDILAYAAKRQIEVIPEVDVPGHNWALLTAYPQFRCPGHPTSNSICASNREGMEFIKAVFDEVIDIFHPRYIHIGGDERKKGIWETCPLDQARMKELGIEDEDALQNDYLREISAHIQSRGVTTIAWAENLEDGIPPDQITQTWHKGEGPMALSLGSRIIVSDNRSCYLDYPASEEELEQKPDWMPVLPVEKVYNFNYAYEGLRDDQKKLIWGGECPLWTELIPQSMIYDQIHERIEAHAERSWTPDGKKDLTRFRKNYRILKSYFSRMIRGAGDETASNVE